MLRGGRNWHLVRRADRRSLPHLFAAPAALRAPTRSNPACPTLLTCRRVQRLHHTAPASGPRLQPAARDSRCRRCRRIAHPLQPGSHPGLTWSAWVGQVKAGSLDPAAPAVARKADAPLDDHLAAYERGLVAAAVSDVYRANVLRAVRRAAADCGLTKLAESKRGPVEAWPAERADEGMSARGRNEDREGAVAFANWCREVGRLVTHDLATPPKADPRADPRRHRWALTEGELGRPLDVATLSDATVGEPRAVGRERVLIDKTLVTTGFRLNVLRTLTVGRLDLAGAPWRRSTRRVGRVAWRPFAPTRRANSGSGSPTPAAGWPTACSPCPPACGGSWTATQKASGIPTRDERGRTMDVHAMRTTSATMLNRAGVAPGWPSGTPTSVCRCEPIAGVARRSWPARRTTCTPTVQAGSKACNPGHTRSDGRARGGRR